jgi:DNA polymerase IV
MQPLSLRAFARAIVHVDADAFLAACEQAVNPQLKGKPVVTGKERGIASAVSYEAKARGVTRGMTSRDIKTALNALECGCRYPYHVIHT